MTDSKKQITVWTHVCVKCWSGDLNGGFQRWARRNGGDVGVGWYIIPLSWVSSRDPKYTWWV